MNVMKRYLILAASAAALFLAAGCSEEQKTAAVFGGFDTECSTVGLYFPGVLGSFTEEYGVQVCMNPQRRTFRLQDSDQSRFAHVVFSSVPSGVSDRVTAEVTVRGLAAVGSSIEMEVVKAEGNRVWLSSETVNMIIPAL